MKTDRHPGRETTLPPNKMPEVTMEFFLTQFYENPAYKANWIADMSALMERHDAPRIRELVIVFEDGRGCCVRPKQTRYIPFRDVLSHIEIATS